jgi:hypothetical protein
LTGEKLREDELSKLPEEYPKKFIPEKQLALFQHVYDSYFGSGKSVYELN